MKKRFIISLAAVLCMVLALSAAGADAITLSGKMIPAETIQIYAPVSGTVEKEIPKQSIIRSQQVSLSLW